MDKERLVRIIRGQKSIDDIGLIDNVTYEDLDGDTVLGMYEAVRAIEHALLSMLEQQKSNREIISSLIHENQRLQSEIANFREGEECITTTEEIEDMSATERQ